MCAQGKILSTAGFSVAFLGRKLNALKWRSLAHMMLGVILITHASAPKNGKDFKVDGDYMIGVGAVLLEVSLSGFAAVYFEKVLKSNTVKLTGKFQWVVNCNSHLRSVWDRNVQMSVLSIGLYLPLWIGDSDPFRGLSVTAWGVSILSEALMFPRHPFSYAIAVFLTCSGPWRTFGGPQCEIREFDIENRCCQWCYCGQLRFRVVGFGRADGCFGRCWSVYIGGCDYFVVVVNCSFCVEGGLSVILSVFNYNESPDEINLPTKDNRVEMRSNLSRLYVPNEDDPKPKFLCC